ncbi:hypothetical protein DDZ13_14890 [Coraliomargarita sinensis]|uniref:ClpX-type ZB domain-containing protein n=1 Tax=Coraliomargarita sinensis TaxID=2174842 RepID=A0A317ZFC4_9BACT|nr:hypothetical protein DDZ13_14890 [Coraliomargarita sinensis]
MKKEESCTCCGKKRSETKVLHACPDGFFICYDCVNVLSELNEQGTKEPNESHPDLSALYLLIALRQKGELSWWSFRKQMNSLKKRLKDYSQKGANQSR